MKRLAALTFCFSLISFAAVASTVTLKFDGPPIGAQVESGVSFTNGSAYSSGGSLYLHDDSGGQLSSMFQLVTGGVFDALSVDMSGIQRLMVSSRIGPLPKAFNNFRWTGYRNGVEVARAVGSLTGGSIVNYLFSAAFTGLTSLQISFTGPTWPHTLLWPGMSLPTGPGQAWCDTYCGSLTIDNLRLAPQDMDVSVVPLPGGFWLLAGALGFGAFVTRRRSQRV